MSENTGNAQEILNKTGGDFLFADLFIQAAKDAAEKVDGYVPQSKIDELHQELKPYKKKRDERFNQ